MAIQRTLNEMISMAEDICTQLSMAGAPSDTGLRPQDLLSSFRYSMLTLAIYIADADHNIDEAERSVIETYLGSCPSVPQMKTLKQRERLEETILLSVPLVLQCASNADKGYLIPQDLYKEQKAQILADTFIMFARAVLAVHKNENDEAVFRLTGYEALLEEYLKNEGAYVPVSKRLFCPETTAAQEASADPEKLAAVLEELNSMVGLQGVKNEINGLVNLIKVQKMRQERGIKAVDVSKHMVFTGNPGTGKTTVARIVAQIYQYMGILSKGTLVETDRAGLVKGYMGQTAARVKEVVQEAMGGVLFIDEAYSLIVDKSEGDYGQEAVDSLLKEMEDHRDDLVVIVAGYPDLMEEFLDSNPGLRSRFNKFIDFEDYTVEEEIAILIGMASKKEYMLDKAALEYAKTYFEERITQKAKEYANARDVRNFLEQAISHHATRVVNLQNVTAADLQIIRMEDVKKCELGTLAEEEA